MKEISEKSSAGIRAFNYLADEYPRLHLATFVHTNASGNKLDFVNNRWQIKLYKEDADKIVVKKSSKTGISEWLMVDTFSNAQQGLNGMYILPDQPIRNRFVTSRIDKIIANTKEYRTGIQKDKKEVDAKALKTMFGKTWSFVGANNPATFYEFNSDINVYDEYDKCNPLSIETATDRTLGSIKDRWRKVGNPTISGYGIDDEYEKSCQYTWCIKCSHCNRWQSLDWFANFVNQEDDNVFTLKDKDTIPFSPITDGDDAKGYCRHCNKPIDRLSKGKWIAKYPDREIKGYHVNRLFGSIARNRNTIREDFQKMLDCVGDLSLMQWFYNNRLGIPYEADGSKISEALLAECVQSDYVMPNKIDKSEPVVAGVDVGGKIHITASRVMSDGKRQKICICSIPLNTEALENVIRRYNIKYGVIDALPETKFVKDFIKRNRGWYRCFYGRQDDKNISVNINHKEKKLNIGRTESLDASLAQYLNHNIVLPKAFMSVDNGDFVKQMVAPTRLYDEKTQRFIWDEGNKADHYRHADNYENIAFDTFCNARKNVRVY